MLIRAPIRGDDKHGSGAYGASRGVRLGKARKHKGVDIACYKGSEVLSITDGLVTKIGYPYNPNDTKKGHLRYVQITHDGRDFRYFYVHPTVSIGDRVTRNDMLRISQGLLEIYPGITDHFHFEVKEGNEHINPMNFLT